MPRKIFVTAPDGSRITRQTHREYSHAILIKSEGKPWEAHSWCGRPELARSKFSSVKAAVRSTTEVVMSPVVGEV